MGNTLYYLLQESGINVKDLVKLTPQKVKSGVRYAFMSSEFMWEVKVAQDLQAIRNKQKIVTGFTDDKMEELFLYICIN